MKPKLFIKSNLKSNYFLKWELPYFNEEFRLVDEPGKDTVLFAFGPDIMHECVAYPALLRAAYVFPWWGFNPVHDLNVRREMLEIIDLHYDAVFVNPGPVRIGLAESKKLHVQLFSVDVDEVRKSYRPRTRIDSLLHVSADAPQKDWRRSEAAMKATGLRFEVFPPRQPEAIRITLMDRIRWRYNKYIVDRFNPTKAFRFKLGYTDHSLVVKKYSEYDGFVHVAAEVNDPLHLDGKYTAAVLEAAITGSIVFWHDTFDDGNDFETIFSLSKEAEECARQILEIRDSINIYEHSKRTSEEVSEKCHPKPAVLFRREVIDSLLDR